MLNIRDSFAGTDPILTSIAQGFTLPETQIANFIAPIVSVPTRSGRILRFGKEQFAISDFRRAYGTNIPYVQSRFDSIAYSIEQEIAAWELPEEVIENAGNGPAQVDLRSIETKNTMSRLMNSYEKSVADAVANESAYEPGLAFTTWTNYETANATLAGGAAWGDSGSQPIKDVLNLKRKVANHIGVRPNSMVLGVNAFDTLMTDPDIVDRIRFTSSESVDVDVLARYFGLSRGVKVAEGRYLNDSGQLLPIFPENGVLLFYAAGDSSNGVMPAATASASTPSFAYTYQLVGSPAVRPEYYIKERRVARAEITVERKLNLVGLGATGLVGSGCFIENILA